MAAQPKRQTAAQIEAEEMDRKSVVFELFLAGLALISLFNILALLILPAASPEYNFIILIDIAVALIFMADFLRDFFQAENKLTYMRWGWIDLLAGIPVLPGMPAFTGAVRLARLAKLTAILRDFRRRNARQLYADVLRQRAKGSLLGILLLGFSVLLVSSFLIVRFEFGAPGAEIESVSEGFYWGLITLTTVGYGDFVPVSGPGRALAGIITLLGIAIVAVGTSYITSSFQGGEKYRDEFEQMRQDIAEMKALLEEMKDEG